MSTAAIEDIRAQPDWLRRLLQHDVEPPRLYRWTAANLAQASPGDKGTSPGNITSNDQDWRRIHILGIGNLGRLFASCLMKQLNPPPITLIVHRKELLQQWIASPAVEITRAGIVEKTTGFDVEWWTEDRPSFGPTEEAKTGSSISNLIVATKASDALPQVDRLRRYLDASSSVAFAQNGMCKLWPPLGDVYTRSRFSANRGPNWIACVTTHGVTSLGPFKSIHASPATVSVGAVQLNSQAPTNAQYLMKQIADAPELAGKLVTKQELFILQLEKLVVNSVINPLTAILRCKNGEILVDRGDELPNIIDSLIQEASDVLTALVLDSSVEDILGSLDAPQASPSGKSGKSTEDIRAELAERFAYPRLRQMVLGVAHKVTENTSSMLQDVLAGKPTEIDDFNGWLVDTNRLLRGNVSLPNHERLISLVRNGRTMSRGDLSKT